MVDISAQISFLFGDVFAKARVPHGVCRGGRYRMHLPPYASISDQLYIGVNNDAKVPSPPDAVLYPQTGRRRTGRLDRWYSPDESFANQVPLRSPIIVLYILQ